MHNPFGSDKHTRLSFVFPVAPLMVMATVMLMQVDSTQAKRYKLRAQYDLIITLKLITGPFMCNGECGSENHPPYFSIIFDSSAGLHC